MSDESKDRQGEEQQPPEPAARRDDPDAPGNYVDDDTEEIPEPNEPA